MPKDLGNVPRGLTNSVGAGSIVRTSGSARATIYLMADQFVFTAVREPGRQGVWETLFTISRMATFATNGD